MDPNSFKKNLNIKLDVFDTYRPQNTPTDNRLIQDMQEAMKVTSKTCFNKCVNVQVANFSKAEEKCVQNCTVGLIENLEYIMLTLDKNREKI